MQNPLVKNKDDLSEGSVFCTLNELIELKASAEKLKFPLKHRSQSQLSGAKRSGLRGRGLDFDEVRAYQAGDEIRSIDWRVTARTGEVHTKVYKEEKEKPVFVLLDLRSSMFFGSKRYFKSVSACQCAALLAWATIKNGDRFGGVVLSDKQHEEFKPKQGNKAVLNFLETASRFSQLLLEKADSLSPNEAKQNFSFALQALQNLVRPGSLVYIISDFYDFSEEDKKNLKLITRHNDAFAIKIQDPLEIQLPQAKRLLFTNPNADENAISEIQGQNKKVLKNYKAKAEQQDSKLQQTLLACGVKSFELSTESNIFEQLQSRKQLR